MNDDVQVLDSGQDTDTSVYTPYEMIEFENGTLVTPASANLETGAVTMPVYSGKAPINAINLNHLEQGLKNLEEYVLSGGVIGGGGGNAPIGSVMIWHGSTAPTGYLICDGSEYGRNSYPDLYDALGVDYQINAEQFKVPDFRGLVPIGAGEHQDTNSKSNTFTLGTEYGEYEHTQTLSEMPNHAHGLTQGYVTEGQSAGYARTGFDGASGLSGTAGEGQPFNIMQPSLAINFIIKASKTTSTLAEVVDSLDSSSTTNAPSIHVVKQELKQLNESINKIGTRIKVFEGNAGPSEAITINTTWEELGKFKNLILELFYQTNNSVTPVTIPFDIMSGGNFLNQSLGVVNIDVPIVNIIDKAFGSIHCIPNADITSNTIKFDSFDSSIKITRMWVDY